MTTRFAHQRLVAYQTSMELTVGVERLCAGFPRGYADLKDQVRRAASSTTRNIAEGANRWTAPDKIARFVIAQAECGECDAALHMVGALELGDVTRLRTLTDRVSAMLTGLIRRQQTRLE